MQDWGNEPAPPIRQKEGKARVVGDEELLKSAKYSAEQLIVLANKKTVVDFVKCARCNCYSPLERNCGDCPLCGFNPVFNLGKCPYNEIPGYIERLQRESKLRLDRRQVQKNEAEAKTQQKKTETPGRGEKTDSLLDLINLMWRANEVLENQGWTTWRASRFRCERGFTVADVHAKLEGVTMEEYLRRRRWKETTLEVEVVKENVNRLEKEGHLYSTIDEDHFQVTFPTDSGESAVSDHAECDDQPAERLQQVRQQAMAASKARDIRVEVASKEAASARVAAAKGLPSRTHLHTDDERAVSAGYSSMSDYVDSYVPRWAKDSENYCPKCGNYGGIFGDGDCPVCDTGDY
jgi:rubrerythrin